jgi:hypothetical protein
MKNTINNYNPRFDLSHYKIGDIYTFHIHNHNINNLCKIEENEFEIYINSLNDTLEKNENIINNDRYLNFTRSIGIVVDTHKSSHVRDIDYITVILKNTSDDFVISKYIVNHESNFCF